MVAMYENLMNAYPQVLFVALIILCRVHNVSYVYVLGYLLNALVNYGLKLFFHSTIESAGNRPIPYRSPNIFPFMGNIGFIDCANRYGFPSGHAQSVGYAVAFVHQVLPWRLWHPAWVVAGVLAVAWLMWTRVAFRRHTVTQVLFGFAFGVAWFAVFQQILRRVNVRNLGF
jgi:membrane-associated phospholipid phosphatase